jgi:hypothetical protein
MRRLISAPAAMLVAIGAAISSLAFADAPMRAQADGAVECRDFTASVLVARQERQAAGKACRQPDGSWRITQEDVVPPEVYVAPPLAVYGAAAPYPYYWGPDPWLPPVPGSFLGGGYYGGYYYYGFGWHQRFGRGAFGGGFFRGGWHN